MVGSHKVAGPFDTKTFLWPIGFNSGRFQLHMSQNVATSMPSLTSQSCSDSLLAGCLPGQASWSHLQTTQAPMDARQACE